MKVTVTEIRKARFQEYEHVSNDCHIDITYEVRVYTGLAGSKPIVKLLDNEQDVETYIKYLKEREKDYSKVIKEIEI